MVKRKERGRSQEGRLREEEGEGETKRSRKGRKEGRKRWRKKRRGSRARPTSLGLERMRKSMTTLSPRWFYVY